MSHRRHRYLRRTLRPHAHIAIAEDAPALPCIVMDLSETDARLVVAAADRLPDDFMLLIGAVERRCRVISRDEIELAVELSRPERRPRLVVSPAQPTADGGAPALEHPRPGTL